MENKGFISVYRKIIDWEWYGDLIVFKVFMHLILRANHKDRRWQGILIKRGQLITSYAHLSAELSKKKNNKISIHQVRLALNKLKSTGEITSESTNEYTMITVKNYDLYQLNDKQRPSRAANERQTNGKRTATNNNVNNDNNVNNEREEKLARIFDDDFSDWEKITPDVLNELAIEYKVPIEFVNSCFQNAKNWSKANNKTKSDYRAFLSKWISDQKVKMKIEESKINSQKSRGGVLDV